MNNRQRFHLSGGCYQLYLMLATIFPSAEAWYNGDHVITKIGDTFVDATGVVDGEKYYPLSSYHNDFTLAKKVATWLANRYNPSIVY